MDVEIPQRIAVLVDRACDRRQAALDSALLSEIKLLCKQGDRNVLTAWQALWGQLRAPHSQTRLLALLLCDELFARSRAFRLALLAKLSQFLEAVLGLGTDRPLPPPPPAAASLRRQALAVLEGWEAQFGGKYKQLPLAVQYLRDTHHYEFPGTATRAAAAERSAREREQRERQQRRLVALLGGVGEGAAEWEEGCAAARQLLAEMGECFTILGEQQAAAARQQSLQELQQHGQSQGAVAAEADGAEGLLWEDVAAGEEGGERAPAAVAATPERLEGLAAYAADDVPALPGSTSTAASLPAVPAGGAVDVNAGLGVVTETLAGLYRQLVTRVLPQFQAGLLCLCCPPRCCVLLGPEQEWVQALGSVAGEGAADEQRRLRLLRCASELRSRLAAARERCDGAALDLEVLLLSRRRREAQQQQQQQQQQQRQQQRGAGGQQQDAAGVRQGAPARPSAGRARQQEDQEAPAVAAAMQELFGGSSSGGSSGDEDEESGQRSERQPRAARGADGPLRRLSDAAQLQGRGRGGKGPPRRRPEEAEEEDWESPYLHIVDPAAPRPRPQQQPPQPQHAGDPRGAAPSSAAAAAARGSGLPEELRKKLVAQAPVLPSGLHTIFWDSSAAPTYVSGRGLEVSNHWGPVDVHKELPQERLDEIFLINMPARQAQQGLQQAQQDAQQAPHQAQQGQQQQRLRQWPSRPAAAAGAERAARAPGGAGPSSSGPASGPAAALAGATEADGGGQGRAAKRARRAQERAYNESVIGVPPSDEALAQQLQDAEQARAGGGGRGRAAAGRGKKMGVRDRLAQKLLRGPAVAAAVADVSLAESEARRDRYSNRW